MSVVRELTEAYLLPESELDVVKTSSAASASAGGRGRTGYTGASLRPGGQGVPEGRGQYT